jgi:hypothetical protein
MHDELPTGKQPTDPDAFASDVADIAALRLDPSRWPERQP